MYGGRVFIRVCRKFSVVVSIFVGSRGERSSRSSFVSIGLLISVKEVGWVCVIVVRKFIVSWVTCMLFSLIRVGSSVSIVRTAEGGRLSFWFWVRVFSVVSVVSRSVRWFLRRNEVRMGSVSVRMGCRLSRSGDIVISVNVLIVVSRVILFRRRFRRSNSEGFRLFSSRLFRWFMRWFM